MVGIADLRQQPSSDNPFVGGLLGYSSFQPGYVISVALQADRGDGGPYGGSLWAAAGAKDAFVQAAAAWSAVANVTIQIVPDNYQGAGNRSAYTWVETLSDLGEGLLGSHDLPGAGELGGEFNNVSGSFTSAANQKGGYGFVTFLHEMGHGLGLTHPFDGPAILPGVTNEYSPGDNNFNSLATTVMSYVDRVGDYSSPSLDYGWAATPMAFDIAAVQLLYGANMSTRTGNDMYVLPSINGAGSYWQTIWDADGTDTLSAEGASSRATIDLRPASLLNEPGGGGWASLVDGSSGGFFIAHDVTIENAIGTSFDDIIYGNDVANTIAGGSGDDQIWGGAGRDVVDGGAGVDIIYGGDDADTLRGGGGNDKLDGGQGDDALAGGAGDDTYTVDSWGDSILELADEGHDIVTASADFVLPPNVEDLRLSGTASIGTGNDGDNRISGEATSVFLHGGPGNDLLLGSPQADRLYGDDGNDTLIAQGGLDELYGGDGDDQLVGGYWVEDPYAGASVPYASPQVEGFAGQLFGASGNDTIFLDGSYRPWATVAHDQFSGKLSLIHYTSRLQIDGGTGTDTVVIASQVDFQGSWTSIERLLFTVPENYSPAPQVTALGPPAVLILTDDRIGLVGDGITLAGTGVLQLDLDTTSDLDGSGWKFEDSAHIDVRFNGSASANRIVGTSQADVIDGGDSNDVLTGGAGNDILRGGSGNDLAIFSGNRTDYRISVEDSSLRVLDLRAGPNDGSDLVSGVETFQFADGTRLSSELAPFTLSASPPFHLVAGTGFVGDLGGSGEVFGTAGHEDITVLDIPGGVTFDPSFNRGGDVIRLAGNATEWTVRTSGSSAVFSDGDTLITVPLGEVGTTLAFDDGARTLRHDASLGAFRIGSQTFGASEVTISAAADGTSLGAADSGPAGARLYLDAGATVSAGGNLDVYGTRSVEDLTLLHGVVTLDPSFNRGGDEIALPGTASQFTAAVTGSSLTLTSAAITLSVPFSPAETTLSFANGDDRLLHYDPQSASVFLDAQLIGVQAVALLPPIA